MADELKNRSFRISDETTEKFRQLCSGFDNQNVALDALISAYEVQQAKAVITERQTDISDYDTHLQALQSAFLHSLELNENAESRIRQEFQRQLDSKDQTIQDLQERVKVAELSEQSANEQATAIADEMSSLRKYMDNQINNLNNELQTTKKALATAEEQITDKQALLDESHRQLVQAQQGIEKLTELEAMARTSEQAQRTAEQENEHLKAELERQKADFENKIQLMQEKAEIAQEKAVLEERAKATERIQALVDETKQLYAEITELHKESQKKKKNVTTK